MKKSIYLLIPFLFVFHTSSFARGVIPETSQESYSSVVYKNFVEDRYLGKIVPEWAIIKTNSSLGTGEISALKLHEKILSLMQAGGWNVYFLPQEIDIQEDQDRHGGINIGDNIWVYENQPRGKRHSFGKIVLYPIALKSDIEITLDTEARKFTFYCTMPIFGDSALWNTFKYRGEPLDKFISNDIVKKYELKLKEEQRYK